MFPTDAIAPYAEALQTPDWHMIFFVASIVLTAWAGFLALSGVEGWILISSLGPWMRGFVVGAAASMTACGLVLFGPMKVPQENPVAWIGIAVVGVVGGALIGHVVVVVFWRTWWLRIFVFGGVLGVLAYAAFLAGTQFRAGADPQKVLAMLLGQVVRAGADNKMLPNWAGIAKATMALAGGGAVYTVAYRLFYPAVWLLRNGTLLALGVVLLVLPAARDALANYMKDGAAAPALRKAVTDRLGVIAILAGVSYLGAAYAMWVQNFSRTFRTFFDKVLETDRKKFRLPSMIGYSVSTGFATLGRMVSLKRASADQCRVFQAEKAQTEDEKEEGKAEKSKGKKASAKS